MDVEKLEVSRETDALVAERVLRLRNVTYEGGEAYCITPHPDEYGFHLGFHLIKRIDTDETVSYVPHYSSDINAAWSVAEKLGLSVIHSEDGYFAIRPVDIWHERVHYSDKNSIRLIGRDGEIFKPAETAPLAICRTALYLAVTAAEGEEG